MTRHNDPRPVAYDGFGAVTEWADPADECTACAAGGTGTCPAHCWECTDRYCPEHLAEGREDAAVDEARARWESDE